MTAQVVKKQRGGERASRECPNCHSKRNWKDGIRETDSGSVQRFLCRECGFRFSESPALSTNLNSKYDRQICVTLQGAKNLTEPVSVKAEPGEVNTDLKGLLTVYMAKASQRGHAETTIRRNVENITWIAKNADLDDPLRVWMAIENRLGWKPGTKQIVACAYKHFCKVFKKALPEDLNFNKWIVTERIPYIPTESEILQLISSSNFRIAPFLMLLFETGMRSGEAWRLKWKDFDLERKIVTLNVDAVEKKGMPRQFRISDRLTAMLNRLPRKSEKIWEIKSLKVLRASFSDQRKRLAFKLQNPNLRKITFHTFRHFYACKLYHSTKDILLVKERLGHRNIQNTMVYTQLVEWDQPDQWTVKRPTTNKEEDELIEAGFEYVRFDDKLNMPIYRKRKWP